MRFTRTVIAAAIGASMVSAPVLAQSAAPLSVASSVRASAHESDANALEGVGGGYLIPALVIIAVLAAAILISNNQGGDLNNPTSP